MYIWRIMYTTVAHALTHAFSSAPPSPTFHINMYESVKTLAINFVEKFLNTKRQQQHHT
jgi:hypothetical protein